MLRYIRKISPVVLLLSLVYVLAGCASTGASNKDSMGVQQTNTAEEPDWAIDGGLPTIASDDL